MNIYLNNVYNLDLATMKLNVSTVLGFFFTPLTVKCKSPTVKTFTASLCPLGNSFRCKGGSVRYPYFLNTRDFTSS